LRSTLLGGESRGKFRDAVTTAARLGDAGFVEIATSLERAPVVFPDGNAFGAFITNVICQPYLAYLPEAARDQFIARITALAAADSPAFELDYRRLNIDARRPE
jgi:hypothetical protein